MPRDRRPTEDPTEVDFALLDLSSTMAEMGMARPTHLRPLVDLLEAVARGERVRAVVAAPRQHGKSETAKFAIAWILRRRVVNIALCTYGQDYSSKRSREVRQLYQRMGGKLSADHNTIAEWRAPDGRGLIATSPGGPLVGHTVHFALIDDPFKGRAEAEVLANRELAHEWLRSDLTGCLTPNGSIIIIASRYHEDDLSGRCIRAGWQHVHLPAICDAEGDPLGRAIGEPLCPWGPNPEEPRTLEFLRGLEHEMGPYDWDSLMQGRPRPRGGALFQNATLYDELPTLERVDVGVDLAYSSAGDWIALVVMGLGSDGVIYVLHVARWQKSIVEALPMFRAELDAHGAGAQLASYVSGPERGVLQLLAMNERPILIHGMPARWNKMYRAEKAATRWNRGGIQVRRGAPWADAFVREVCGFTGLDGVDDQVDALVSGHDWMMLAGALSAPSSLRGPYVW